MTPDGDVVILASASASRAKLLTNAGIAIRISPARVDEDEVKRALGAEGADASRIAEALAELKAIRVSQKIPGTLVIGADQMLEVEGRFLDKPVSVADAKGHLMCLRGRSHTLVSAVCVALDGQRIWSAIDRAELVVRQLTDQFIDDYLAHVGDAVTQSVGAYQLEGRGAQIFSRISGDYFTILGLPLLPLMAFLRDRKILID